MCFFSCHHLCYRLCNNMQFARLLYWWKCSLLWDSNETMLERGFLPSYLCPYSIQSEWNNRVWNILYDCEIWSKHLGISLLKWLLAKNVHGACARISRCMSLNFAEKSLHLYREEQLWRMFWKFNYLTSDLDNLLDKEVSNVSLLFLGRVALVRSIAGYSHQTF